MSWYPPKKKQAKYRNVKTYVDGIKFDSKAEARRYSELKLLVRTGVISSLVLQPSFEVLPKVKEPKETFLKREAKLKLLGKKTSRRWLPARRYTADFQYIENGNLIVEEVKGEITAKETAYRLRRHAFLVRHGEVIDLRETNY